MSQQTTVYEELVRGGPGTAAELTERLGLKPNSGVSARLSELCRAGKVERCGISIYSRNPATVYRALAVSREGQV